MAPVRYPFPSDIAGLSEASATQFVELSDSAVFDLRAGAVRMRIGEATVKMLAYNGSIPGPILKVAQGSEVTVDFTNHLDLDTTVHWHGLRLDNRFDGVPHGKHQGMQAPIPPGGGFAYRLRFPDPGLYWYHPHVREDYTQEHGLYGNILVVPGDPAYWAPVNRELTLVLDDILIEGGQVAPFSQAESDRTLMGRFGNVMLTNGQTFYSLAAGQGEVVRLYLTNTANVRTFNFAIPGARVKLVGSDEGCVEREEFVDEVLLSPSERVVLDVLFPAAGRYPLEHRTPVHTYTLGSVEVSQQPAGPSFAREFLALRRNAELEAERARIAADLDRPPDKTLALVGEMPGMQHHGEGQHGQDQHGQEHHSQGQHGPEHPMPEIEWEDTMAMMNLTSSPDTMSWKMIDRETGAANHGIVWSFRAGDRVKVRIVNEPHSDHPMQHPVHFHGQRFLVLSRNGAPNDNLAWKDTVLVRTGETVDILLDASNPGAWMAHCHIAEHLEAGMMFTFHVNPR
jgi:FtsP/CotA-like multicopper oxidase with cupredoxin domain